MSAMLTMVWGHGVFAQSAKDRAVQIKEWREKCNDPDPDLRLANLESAIATNDRTVMRTCVRQALSSDNADMRNLGLRAALAMNERLTFKMTLPDKVAKAIAQAGGNDKRLLKVRRAHTYTISPFDSIGGVFTFVTKNSEISSPNSEWSTLGLNSDVRPDMSAVLTVSGSQVSGTGKVLHSGDNNLKMLLRLNSRSELVGTVDFGRSEPIPVVVKLL